MCFLKNQPNAFNKMPKSTCEIPKSYHGITLKKNNNNKNKNACEKQKEQRDFKIAHQD